MVRVMSEENVLLHQNAISREDALRIISEHAVAHGMAQSAEAVYEGFIAREELDRTGLVEGFAIPHCKSKAIGRAAIIVFKNETKLEWPSLDEGSVDIALALLVPEEEAGTTHLKLLTKAAVLLMEERFKNLLRSCDDECAIASAINVELER